MGNNVLEGGATRIVDWMDQNTHDLFIPTYYHLLFALWRCPLWFLRILRNIKIDALFDVAYIKARARARQFSFLICFARNQFARLKLKLRFCDAQVHYQEFWFPSFCMCNLARCCFSCLFFLNKCIIIPTLPPLWPLFHSTFPYRSEKRMRNKWSVWCILHIEINYIFSMSVCMAVLRWYGMKTHWNYVHYDNF